MKHTLTAASSLLRLPTGAVEEFLDSDRLHGEKSHNDDWLIDDFELRRFTGADLGKTPGEKRFIFYLHLTAIPFDYERAWPGRAKVPDFVIRWRCRDFPLEVKDLTGAPPARGFSYFDPVKPIRDHINEAQKQFREFGGFPCLIGLYNVSTLTYLDDPATVFGAMHGPVELRFAFDTKKGRMVDAPPEQMFSGKKAKMRATQDEESPRNRRISALVCLRTIEIGPKRATRYLMQFPAEEWTSHIGEEVPFEPEEARLGVSVYENVDALVPLPDGLFRGDFDVRWRIVDGEVRRVFAGKGIEELERLDQEIHKIASEESPGRGF